MINFDTMPSFLDIVDTKKRRISRESDGNGPGAQNGRLGPVWIKTNFRTPLGGATFCPLAVDLCGAHRPECIVRGCWGTASVDVCVGEDNRWTVVS